MLIMLCAALCQAAADDLNDLTHLDPRVRRLIDESDISNFRRDYLQIDTNNDSYISKQELLERLKEDRTPEEMNSFWEECDLDGNYECTFPEYIQARGWFDQNGEEYHQNEWDEREVGDSGGQQYTPEPDDEVGASAFGGSENEVDKDDLGREGGGVRADEL
jgi:hypothetical protein